MFLPFLLGVGLLLALPSSATACSCVPFDASRVADADAAIVGEVVAVEEPAPMGAVRRSGDPKLTRITIETSKTDELEAGTTVDVISATSSASCGLSLEVGDEAGLLLSRVDDDAWSGTSCGTTSAAEMKAALGESVGDAADAVEQEPPSIRRLVLLLLGWIFGAERVANTVGEPVDVIVSSAERPAASPAVPPCVAEALRSA